MDNLPQMHKCDLCGKVFPDGNRPDGIPNGIGFVRKDGSVLTMCADCIIRVGEVRGEVCGGGAK